MDVVDVTPLDLLDRMPTTCLLFEHAQNLTKRAAVGRTSSELVQLNWESLIGSDPCLREAMLGGSITTHE